jgi:uncharacterized C2H2 Zn-finger protein
MPRHICALCGQISFKYYHEYETHRAIAHGLKTAIKPERVTGRSTARIVKEAEATWLKDALIDGTRPAIIASNNQHLEACRCDVCFQKKLDDLVNRSEKSLESLNKSVTLE